MKWAEAYALSSTALFLGWTELAWLFLSIFGESSAWSVISGSFLGILLTTNWIVSLFLLLTHYYLAAFNPTVNVEHVAYLMIPVCLRFFTTIMILWGSPMLPSAAQFCSFVLFVRFIVNSFRGKDRCRYNMALVIGLTLPTFGFSMFHGFEPLTLYLTLELVYSLLVEKVRCYHEEEIQPMKLGVDLLYFALRFRKPEWRFLVVRYIMELLATPLMSCLIDLQLICLEADYAPVFEIAFEDAPEYMERKGPRISSIDELLAQMDIYRDQLSGFAAGFGRAFSNLARMVGSGDS